MALRASFTQPGHSESVCRGQPSVGLVFSHDLSSGLSDHFGVNDGFGFTLELKNWTVLKAAVAVVHAARSTSFHAVFPIVLGIVTPSVWSVSPGFVYLLLFILKF